MQTCRAQKLYRSHGTADNAMLDKVQKQHLGAMGSEFPRFPCYSLFRFIASDQANAWRPCYCGVFGSSRVEEGAEKQKIPCKFAVFRQIGGAEFADDCLHRQQVFRYKTIGYFAWRGY